MPVYRPSAALRLSVRLDEGRQTAELLARLEPPRQADTSAIGKPESGVQTEAPREIRASAQQISTLAKLDEATGGADPALKRELERVLQKRRELELIAAPSDQPEALAGSAPDGLSITIGSLPVVRCSIARASFRTGDKASFELSYYDAPFNPVLMRSAGVELSLDVISAEEFDAGVHGMRREDGSRYSTVEDLPGVTRATRFLGFVSKWNLEFGDDGPRVIAEAQDMMSLLRDTPLPADLEIDHDLPIEQGIKAMLESFPATRGIKVVFGPPGEGRTGPIPDTAAARRKKTVKKGKRRVRRNAENTNIWDHVTDVCVGVACIPCVDGLVLRIDYARTLYGTQPKVPRMVWGRNLENLRFSRAMAGAKTPTVEARSYSSDLKRTIAARYPDPDGFGVAVIGVREFPAKPPRATRVLPSGKPDQTIRVVGVSGISSGPLLQDIARGIYEETARQEIEGSFTTKDPSSYEVDFAAANLLDLKAGQPIRIEIDARGQGEIGDAVTALQGMTLPERVARLEQAGFRRQVASAYAVLLDAQNLQTVFCVSTVDLDFDQDDGLKVEVNFQNYIVVREEAQASAAAAPTKRASARTAGQKGPAAARVRANSEQRAKGEQNPQAPKYVDLRDRAREGADADYYDELFADPQTRF